MKVPQPFSAFVVQIVLLHFWAWPAWENLRAIKKHELFKNRWYLLISRAFLAAAVGSTATLIGMLIVAFNQNGGDEWLIFGAIWMLHITLGVFFIQHIHWEGRSMKDSSNQ